MPVVCPIIEEGQRAVKFVLDGDVATEFRHCDFSEAGSTMFVLQVDGLDEIS